MTKAKHRVGYDSSWQKEYPWHIPVYGSDETTVIGVLYALCKQHNVQQRNKSGTWTEKPCTLLRKDLLQRHKTSSMHKEAEQRETARQASQRDGGIRQAFSTRIMVQRKALIGALQLVYLLAKEEIAHTTKFNSLKDLVIHLGCDFLRELSLGRNAQYSIEQIISELLQCISLVIKEQIVSDMQSSLFFSLMTDESTDISVLKQLVLVGCYVTDGGVKTAFLHIGNIVDCRAETIEKAILEFLSSNGLSISKLRSFGSDGAAVMVGRVSGVGVRLQAHSPTMIAVHCFNHRLALAAAHASDSVPYLKQFKSILQTLFYFYQNSAVRTASLHAIQEVLNDPSIKCKQAKDVRWLSHENAIKAVVCTLPFLLVSLDREASEHGEPTAHGLYKFMKSYKFVACTYLLHDVLPHLSRLSRVFQKRDVDLTLIQPCLKTTIDAIMGYKETPGPNLKRVDEVLATKLKDFGIKPTPIEKEAFKSGVQQVYVQAIVDELGNRFPNVELLDAFSIFDPKYIPTEESQLVSYGHDKLEVILSRYREDVDPQECTSEWEGFKRLLHNTYSELSMHQVLHKLCTDQSLIMLFPNLSKLCNIAALIPVSTAERAFSTMNRIKTELRNQLKTTTLDSLMSTLVLKAPR